MFQIKYTDQYTIGKNMPQPVEKQTQIIKAAKKLFLKYGFQATSMDDIAMTANVTKRTVYHHFANKIELFQAMLHAHWNSISQASHSFSILEKTAPPQKSLNSFGKKFLEFLYQSDTIDLFRLLIAESEHFPDLCKSLVQEGKAPFTRELIEYLKAQARSGNLVIDDYELAASHFMGLLKEDQFWPRLLGFTKKIDKKRIDIIVDKAVIIFLNFYGR